MDFIYGQYYYVCFLIYCSCTLSVRGFYGGFYLRVVLLLRLFSNFRIYVNNFVHQALKILNFSEVQ